MPEMARTSAPPLPSSLLRLADHLQRLSEVAESLTYRLVDLEERLLNTERSLEERLMGDGAEASHDQGDAVDLRLLDTEERLLRLEELLQAGPIGAAMANRQGRSLAAVPDPATIQQGDVLDDGHFIEDGEQPFMDELTA